MPRGLSGPKGLHVLTFDKTLAKEAEISNDYFVRTTDSDHRDVVEYVWVGQLQLLLEGKC